MKKKIILFITTLFCFALIGCGQEKIDKSNIQYIKLTPTPTNIETTENPNDNKKEENTTNTISDNSIENIVENTKEFVDKEDFLTNNENEDVNIDSWGITLTTENVSSKGVTIICNQANGEDIKELITGSFFCLQKFENGEWVDVPYKDSEIDFCWTAEAWIIPLNDSVSWHVNWDWIYGELSSGEYRIGKEIMNFRETGDYDESIMYANFIIE